MKQQSNVLKLTATFDELKGSFCMRSFSAWVEKLQYDWNKIAGKTMILCNKSKKKLLTATWTYILHSHDYLSVKSLLHQMHEQVPNVAWTNTHSKDTHTQIQKPHVSCLFSSFFYFLLLLKKLQGSNIFELEAQPWSPPAKTIQSRGEERKSTTYNIYPKMIAMHSDLMNITKPNSQEPVWVFESPVAIQEYRVRSF